MTKITSNPANNLKKSFFITGTGTLVFAAAINVLSFALGWLDPVAYDLAWYYGSVGNLEDFYWNLLDDGGLDKFRILHYLDVLFWFFFYPFLAVSLLRMEQAFRKSNLKISRFCKALIVLVIIAFAGDAAETSMVLLSSFQLKDFSRMVLSVHHVGKILTLFSVTVIILSMIILGLIHLIRRVRKKAL